jgi:hypothetical protein
VVLSTLQSHPSPFMSVPVSYLLDTAFSDMSFSCVEFVVLSVYFFPVHISLFLFLFNVFLFLFL